MIVSTSPLQFLPIDLISLVLAKPFEASLIVLLIAGYVFLALTARRTTLWRHSTSSERILIATAISAGFEILAFMPLLATYFTLYHGAFDVLTPYYQSVTATIMFLVVLPLGLRAQHVSEGLIRKIFSSGSYILLIINVFVLSAAFWLTVFSEFYSPEARFFQFPYLFITSGIWYISCITTFGVYFIYTNLYHRQLHIYLIEGRIGIRRLANSRLVRWIRRFNSLHYMKKGIAVAVSSFLIVTPVSAADNAFALFTPGVLHQTGPYHARGFQFANPITYVVNVKGDFSQLRTNHTVPCSITAYEPVIDNITIKVPASTIFALNNITITNPSSISVVKGPLSYLPMLQPGPIWQNLLINNSKHLQIQPKPSERNVQQLSVGFSNASRSSTLAISMLYFKTAAPRIDCSDTVTYSPPTNNTLIVTHEFKIENRERSLAVIQTIDLRDIVFFGANSSSISMLRNGTVSNAFYAQPYSGELNISFGEVSQFHHVTYTVSFRGRS